MASATEGPWYLDTSAFLKLVFAEPESPGLRAFVAGSGPVVSSDLLRIESQRACRRVDPAALDACRGRLGAVDRLVRIGDQVIEAAAALEPVGLRSPDAVHLATAQLVQPDLAGILTYDDRLATAAEGLGIEVAAPG